MQNVITDIFNDHFTSYSKENGAVSSPMFKAVNAITSCRTERLGIRQYYCDQCGIILEKYNSCRNRHCPTCQSNKAVAWAQKQIKSSLPVGYFHGVFTLPQQLRSLVLFNKKILYDLLFIAVKQTLTTLAEDKKHLGASIGFIAVLHTWTRQLLDHPHIHCIIPAGGIRNDKKRWKYGNQEYLFPVEVMSILFKNKFLSLLKQKMRDGEVNVPQFYITKGVKTPFEHTQFFNDLYEKKWVVYVKKPFATPDSLIKYLSQYTHRIAISPKRIQHYDGKNVTLWYIDSNTNQKKYLLLSAHEFIRRFLLHILPPRFVRIRYYGYLTGKNKALMLKKIQQLLEERIINGNKPIAFFFSSKNFEPLKDEYCCPECKKGNLKILQSSSKGLNTS